MLLQTTRRFGLISKRHQSTSVFAYSHLRTFFPRVKITKTTSLGEIYDAFFTNYKYKMAYPLLAWSAFCYTLFWIPYKPESEKAQELARINKLKRMEFHQD